MKKLYLALIIAFLGAASSYAVAPVLTTSVVNSIKDAGTDKVALSKIITKLLEDAPANKQATIMQAFMADLDSDAASDQDVLVAITGAAVGAAKVSAAKRGAGYDGQLAAMDEIAGVILKAVGAEYSLAVITAAVQAGGSQSQLMAVSSSGSGISGSNQVNASQTVTVQ